ncbi:hypothetical protein [Micromonospora luteifusca]|uniref:hypothetical protein n=1 Tax=Micromonospora luteifusca TaxID=709860 RepID=UPI0033BCFF6E
MTRIPDLKDLVRRAKEGAVTRAEQDEVATLLAEGRGGESTYQLLYVLGRTSDTRHEPMVAKLLDRSDDPMVSRLALQTLCQFWGFTGRYVDAVERFLDGVEWDDFDDVKDIAISIAGDYLASNRQCGMLRRLLAIAGDSTGVQHRITIEALAVAMGEPVGSAINADKGDTPWQVWADEVVSRAEGRQRAEC